MIYEIDRFPGLDLSLEPGDDQGAVDMLNVDIDRNDKVRSRDGLTTLTTDTALATYGVVNKGIVYNRPNTASQLVLDMSHATGTHTASVVVINTSGTVVAAITNPGDEHYRFTRWGNVTQDRVYIANDDGTGGVFYWDGSTFISPAWNGIPAVFGTLLAVTPNDNRLVSANWPTSDPGERSLIRFSEEGLPQNFLANDFLYLTPGDGEQITGMAVWRDSLIVFKESKFFRFYGTSIKSDGTSEFNYTTIDTGIGMPVFDQYAVAAEGVYFVGIDGVYLTTGGAPKKISQPIDPLFTGRTTPHYRLGSTVLAQANRPLVYTEGRVYFSPYDTLSITTGVAPVYVYDTVGDYWLAWAPAGGMHPLCAWDRFPNVVSAAELIFGGTHLAIQSQTAGQDMGDDFATRYRTPFYNPAQAKQAHKTIADTILRGTGAVELAASRDFGALGVQHPVTFGADQISRRIPLVMRGRVFSLEFSSTGLPWSVDSYSHNVRGVRKVASAVGA